MGLERVKPTVNTYKLCEGYTIGAGEEAKFYFNAAGYGSVIVNTKIDGLPYTLPWRTRIACVYDNGDEGYNWVQEFYDVATGETKTNNGATIIGFNLTMDKHVVKICNDDEVAHDFTCYVRMYPYPFGPSNQVYLVGVENPE